MRTTIDLPDDLFREVKARAALNGMKLTDLIARYVAAGLHEHAQPAAAPTRPKRSAPPLNPKAMTGEPIPMLENEDLDAIEMGEDLEKLRRSFGR